MIEHTIDEFLIALEASKEAALLVAEATSGIVPAAKILEQKGIVHARSQAEILAALTVSRSVFFILSEGEFSKDLYDIVFQYSARQGMIQLLDDATHLMRTIRYNPREAKFILLTSQEVLEKIEQHMPIQDKVGITEII